MAALAPLSYIHSFTFAAQCDALRTATSLHCVIASSKDARPPRFSTQTQSTQHSHQSQANPCRCPVLATAAVTHLEHLIQARWVAQAARSRSSLGQWLCAQGAEGEGVVDAEEGQGVGRAPAAALVRTSQPPVACRRLLARSLSSPADTMAVRILVAATSADKLLDGRPTGCWCALSVCPSLATAAVALLAACQLHPGCSCQLLASACACLLRAVLTAPAPPAAVLPLGVGWRRLPLPT
jgi:hypothetical protein